MGKPSPAIGWNGVLAAVPRGHDRVELAFGGHAHVRLEMRVDLWQSISTPQQLKRPVQPEPFANQITSWFSQPKC